MTVIGANRIPVGAARLLVVVFGGLVVLQSSDELDPAKIGYFALVLACLAVAIVSLLRHLSSESVRALWPVFALSGALAVWVIGSFFVAMTHGVGPVDWLRDAAGYGLAACIPVFAWDAGTSGGSRSRRLQALTAGMVVLGLLATASWGVEWFTRRGIVDLQLERLLMPGGYLAIALYATALAVAMASRRRHIWWVMVAGIVLGSLWATGTRSALLLLLLPLLSLLVSRQMSGLHRVRAAISHTLLAAGIVLLVGFATAPRAPSTVPPGSVPGSAPPIPRDRITSVGDLLNHAAEDPSVRERMAQYSAAWRLFMMDPVFGAGLGHPIRWTDVSGHPESRSTADTPLVLPAKLGIIGTVIVVLLGTAYGWYLNASRRRMHRVQVSAAGLFVVAAAAMLPLGMPIEDKSFSFGMAMLLALVVASHPWADLPSTSHVPATEGHV